MKKFVTTALLMVSLSIQSTSYADEDLDFIQKNVESAQQQTQAPYLADDDPYEPFNRVMFSFNMVFNDYIGQPVGQAYLDYTPQPIKTGLSNFFDNLSTPISALNNFLQGKPQAGLEGIMRFSLNTVLGFGGLLDIATPAGLTPEEEDFGQTLAKWRVWPEAHYLVLPFLGSTTTRKLAGDTADGITDPVYQAKIIEDKGDSRLDLSIGNGFINYVKVVPLLDEVKKQPDPYVFVRESYLQHRKSDLYDGKPPTPALDDFNFE